MTKVHETFHFGSLEKIVAELRVEGARGEYTLLLAGAGFEAAPRPRIDIPAYVSGLMLLREMSRAEAVKTQPPFNLSYPDRKSTGPVWRPITEHQSE